MDQRRQPGSKSRGSWTRGSGQKTFRFYLKISDFEKNSDFPGKIFQWPFSNIPMTFLLLKNLNFTIYSYTFLAIFFFFSGKSYFLCKVGNGRPIFRDPSTSPATPCDPPPKIWGSRPINPQDWRLWSVLWRIRSIKDPFLHSNSDLTQKLRITKYWLATL